MFALVSREFDGAAVTPATDLISGGVAHLIQQITSGSDSEKFVGALGLASYCMARISQARWWQRTASDLLWRSFGTETPSRRSLPV